MKDLKATHADALLQRLIAEGEHVGQDFKFTVNDPRKIARSVSAFANNAGGHLLIGVDDNGNIRGVRNEEDIYIVEAAAEIYCQPACTPTFTAYKAKGGVVVIRADIAKSTNRPVFVKETDNKLQAYYRVADENIVAHPLMVRAWKMTDDPDRNIFFNINSYRTSILTTLQGAPLTFEQLSRKIKLSKAKLEDAIVELAAMNVIDFTFTDRQFYITLREST